MAWLGAGQSVAQEWEIVSSLPEPRAGATAVELDGFIYVIGGRSPGARATASVLRYNPTTNEWANDVVPDLYEPRVNAAATTLGRKIVVAGGRGPGGEVLQSVEVYDPDLNEWLDFPDTKRSREGATAVMLRGTLYLIGGSDQGERALETVEIFDTVETEWDEVSDWKLDRPRVSSAAAVLNGSIYIFGGFNTFGPVGQVQQFNSFSGTVSSTDMPIARGALAAIALGRSIYVIGGRSQDRVLDITEIFRPDVASWSDAARLNVARFGFASAAVDNSIFVFGGLGSQSVPLSSVEKLGPIVTANDELAVPPDVALKEPFPNPFGQKTHLEYSVSPSHAGSVRIEILDITGRIVRTLGDVPQGSGYHEIVWEGDSNGGEQVASGMYLIRMRQGPFSIIRKALRIAG